MTTLARSSNVLERGIDALPCTVHGRAAKFGVGAGPYSFGFTRAKDEEAVRGESHAVAVRFCVLLSYPSVCFFPSFWISESLNAFTVSPRLLFSYCLSAFTSDAKGKVPARLRFVGTDLAHRALVHAYPAAESFTAPCAAVNSLAWPLASRIAQRLATLGQSSANLVANIKRTRVLAVSVGRPGIPAQATLAREANKIYHVPLLVRRPFPVSSTALCSVARQWIDASALGG
jgi:hypothetical protein